MAPRLFRGFTQRPDPTVMGAFSGLEIACWDIVGKARDRPVHELWGGRVHDRLRTYTYLYPQRRRDPATFYNDPDASAACAARMVAQGFTAVKFDPAGAYTIHGGHQPSLARPRPLRRPSAASIREAVGDQADLLFGTHGQFTPSGAIRLARRLEPYEPLWFEEPVPPDLPARAGGGRRAVADPDRHRRAADHQVRVRHPAARRRRLDPADEPRPGRRPARSPQDRGMAESFDAQIAPHLYGGPIAWAAGDPARRLSIPNFLILETIRTGGGFHAEPPDTPDPLGGRLRHPARRPRPRRRARRERSPAPTPGPATACTSR